MATRRLRAFKRWMDSKGIEYSDTLQFTDNEEGIAVRAICDLKEGDVVASIPKQACLTVKTSGARHVIEETELAGLIALCVAVMYERSLGPLSPWAGYLQLLPEAEWLPLLWSADEVDSLLGGTELHEIVKEDKAFIYEDWEECILPLMNSASLKLDPEFFGIDNYFAAKSLIASRSFQIDEYHGFGMVPLADLFNHKTGAEDVHFTSVSSHLGSDNDVGIENDDAPYSSTVDEPFTQSSPFRNSDEGNSSTDSRNLEKSSNSEENPMFLEMIIVKDVKSGAEVFNTYGSLGNAALLHRYGFTEANNPFDIVNIDLELVVKWSLSLFSSRYSRARLSLWRRLGYSGCVSQNSEYFEISYDGEPQVELLVLLYIILLPDETYQKLDLAVPTAGDFTKSLNMILLKKRTIKSGTNSERKDLLLTNRVYESLLSLADIRESFYGSDSLEDDIDLLKRCCRRRERNLYHSLMLRVSERRILKQLRVYASRSSKSTKRSLYPLRKKFKWT